ncbi:hypothetical protein DFH11DRAFT_1732754 [Phellopilus nigrolimitatus]|nr:hypothetical protein DFH11DRAFT_1732754 [Phellopilus nigrolimitatus]
MKIDITRTTRIAVLGLCRTAISSTSQTSSRQRARSLTFIFRSFRVQHHRAARFSRSPSTSKAFGAARPLPVLGHPQRYTRAYDPDEAAALLDSEEGHAIARTSLVVDDLCRDLVRARGNFAAEGERARSLSRTVLDATFAVPVDADKVRDARGLLRQLRMRMDGATVMLWLRSWSLRSTRAKTGSDLGERDSLLGLIKLYVERFGDKACCFDDLKPYTLLEDAELSALNSYLDVRVSDTEPTLCHSINTHKLRRHVLGADELSAAQETEHALAYFRAYAAALELGGALLQSPVKLSSARPADAGSRRFCASISPVFLLGSDIDETVEKLLIGDRPKAADIPENKIPLKDCIHLTADERTIFDYVSVLRDWLRSNHDHARPQQEALLANDPPEDVRDFLDSMAARFKEGSGKYRLPWEVLHISTLTQEATLMLALASVRFKAPAVVKANKFDWLTANLCTLLEKESADLKNMASVLAKTGT